MTISKPWLPYQNRVLEALLELVTDGHSHIVPPVFGKAVTGLKVIRPIGLTYPVRSGVKI